MSIAAKYAIREAGACTALWGERAEGDHLRSESPLISGPEIRCFSIDFWLSLTSTSIGSSVSVACDMESLILRTDKLPP